MHVHAMGFVVEGQGLIMMDGILNKGSHGIDPSQCTCVILYICTCVLFYLFLCYNKGNLTMDAMLLPVCAHLYRDVCM